MFDSFSVKKILFPITLLLLIIIAFITLQPTSASTIIPGHQEQSWDTFVQQTQNQKRIDTQKYWQTREFYSPGSFVFNKHGLPAAEQKKLLTQIHLAIIIPSDQITFLKYSAPGFTSYESLIPQQNQKATLKVMNTQKNAKNVIAKGDNYIIFKTDEHKAILVFLANYDEMKRANGFFEYAEEDKEVTQNKIWLSVSEIKI